jgi:hypothetical protein
MVIVRELAETRLLSPSRSREEREKCMTDMRGTGGRRVVNPTASNDYIT